MQRRLQHIACRSARRLCSHQRRSMSTSSPFIVMDAFCLRSFSRSSPASSSSFIDAEPDALVRHVNAQYEQLRQQQGDGALKPGYAPFCCHLFIPNHLSLPSAYAAITEDNSQHLSSAYVARTEKELPVLMRFFPKHLVQAERATWLDIILYSREQIEKENAAMAGRPPSAAAPSLPPLSPSLSTGSSDSRWRWGIVSIKPQSADSEVPMLPITMMRNALGVDEGGSGVALDRDKYTAAVEFWSRHANVQ